MNNPYAAPSLNPEPAGFSDSTGAVTAGVLEQLRLTKPWVRFFSVLMFIGAGFMLLIAVIMGVAGGFGAMAGAQAGAFGGLGVAMALLYGLMALLYVYPGMKLWSYANRIAGLLSSCHPVDLEAALNEQRKFWKFAGVMAIVLIFLPLPPKMWVNSVL